MTDKANIDSEDDYRITNISEDAIDISTMSEEEHINEFQKRLNEIKQEKKQLTKQKRKQYLHNYYIKHREEKLKDQNSEYNMDKLQKIKNIYSMNIDELRTLLIYFVFRKHQNYKEWFENLPEEYKQI